MHRTDPETVGNEPVALELARVQLARSFFPELASASENGSLIFTALSDGSARSPLPPDFDHPVQPFPLDEYGAVHCVYDTGQFAKGPIAHKLNDPTVVLGDERFDELFAKEAEVGKRAVLILLHEPAIANHVRGKDGGKTAVGAFFGHIMRLPLENADYEIVLSPR